MSPCSWGSSFWSEVTGAHRIRDTVQQRQVITYTFIRATPSAFVFLCFIISQTRPQTRDAFEDTQARRL